MLEITEETQMLEGYNDIGLWNKLIKIARKYEREKYGESYTDLSSFIYLLGNLGHNIKLDEPSIKPNYTDEYTQDTWRSIWKDVYKAYDDKFVDDLKKCLKILKKYNNK